MKNYIKMILILLLLTGTISCYNMIGDLYDTPADGRPVIWKDVGKLSIAASTNPKLVGYNGKLFAAWVETSNIYVKYFNGDDENPLWTQINLPCATGQCSEPFMAVYGSTLFITYIDFNAVLVKTYNNDGTWSAPTVDLIDLAAGNTPELVVHNSNIYLTWIETGLVRMRKFNGGTSWIWDGLTDFSANPNGINDIANTISTYSLTSRDNELYVAMEEFDGTDQVIKVRKFDGFIWSNYSTDYHRYEVGFGNAYNPSLLQLDGEIYLAWNDGLSATYANGERISVIDMDGFGWRWIDGGDYGQIRGIRYFDHTIVPGAREPMLAEINGKLYAAWIETDAGIDQIRCSLYDDDDNSWQFIDGNSSEGLNFDPFNNANSPYTISFDSKIYPIYLQLEGVDVVRVLVGK